MNYKESMEEDDMVMSRVGNTQVQRERDEPMKRTRGLQARGIFKEVLRLSQRLALVAAKRSLILPLPLLKLAPSLYLINYI